MKALYIAICLIAMFSSVSKAQPTYNDIMASALKEFDSSSYSDDIYNAIAWEGLRGTAAYASFMADPENSKKYNQTMELAKLLPQENCSQP